MEERLRLLHALFINCIQERQEIAQELKEKREQKEEHEHNKVRNAKRKI